MHIEEKMQEIPDGKQKDDFRPDNKHSRNISPSPVSGQNQTRKGQNTEDEQSIIQWPFLFLTFHHFPQFVSNIYRFRTRGQVSPPVCADRFAGEGAEIVPYFNHFLWIHTYMILIELYHRLAVPPSGKICNRFFIPNSLYTDTHHCVRKEG